MSQTKFSDVEQSPKKLRRNLPPQVSQDGRCQRKEPIVLIYVTDIMLRMMRTCFSVSARVRAWCVPPLPIYCIFSFRSMYTYYGIFRCLMRYQFCGDGWRAKCAGVCDNLQSKLEGKKKAWEQHQKTHQKLFYALVAQWFSATKQSEHLNILSSSLLRMLGLLMSKAPLRTPETQVRSWRQIHPKLGNNYGTFCISQAS